MKPIACRPPLLIQAPPLLDPYCDRVLSLVENGTCTVPEAQELLEAIKKFLV